MSESISFAPGDTIKFQMTGHAPETAAFFLPKLRERTYFGVTVIEKNGEPISPTPMEIGLYNDELPTNIRITKKGDQLEIDGLDPTKYLTAQLKGGFPRAAVENVGGWVEYKDVPFFVPSTLHTTNELAPALAQQETPADAKSPTGEARMEMSWFERMRSKMGHKKAEA